MKIAATLPISLVLFALLSSALAEVSPARVFARLRPGRGKLVWKKITIPKIPQKVDVCLVQDLSGSYRDDLPNLKAQSGAITSIIDTADAKFGLVGFKDYPIRPFGGSGDFAFKLIQALGTADDFKTAVNGLSASGGGDLKESQYDAIVSSTTEKGCGFRDDVTRIIIGVSDAPCHTPADKPASGASPYKNDEASTIKVLQSNGITFIGLYTGEEARKCFQPLAEATGGAVVELMKDSKNIAAAINTAIKELKFDVTPKLLPSRSCKGVKVVFKPKTVKGLKAGEMAKFKEYIHLSRRVRNRRVRRCQVDFEPAGVQNITVTPIIPWVSTCYKPCRKGYKCIRGRCVCVRYWCRRGRKY